VIWQDAITAEEYACTYHDLYQLIKAADPQAQIAVAGVAQATPLRLAYLDRVLSTYQTAYGEPMPVDWWTVHGFVLREESGSWGVEIPPGFTVQYGQRYEIEDHASIDLFKKQILAFRAWMEKNGYRNKPLALTEFGILMPQDYGFPTELVQQYMRDSFTWLASATDASIGQPQDGNHLVQRWAWFSLSDPFYPGSDLADLPKGCLTPLGETYREFVSNYLP